MGRPEPSLLGVYGSSDSVCFRIRVHWDRSKLGIAAPREIAELPGRADAAGRRPARPVVEWFHITGADSCRVNVVSGDSMVAPSHRVTVRGGIGELHLSDGTVLTTVPLDITFELDARRGSLRFCGGCRPRSPDRAWDYHRTWRLMRVTPAAAPDTPQTAIRPRLAIRAITGHASPAGELELTLTSHAPATVEWFDVQGRRRAFETIADPAPGPRRVAWPASVAPSGVYWARVRQAGQQATSRAVVLR